MNGYATKLRMGFESSFSVPILTTGYQVGFAPTLDAMTEQAINKSTVMTGSANPTAPFLGYKDGKFSAQIPMDDKALGLFLKGAYGSPVTTLDTPAVGLNSHVFKINKDASLAIPSMYCEVEHTDVIGGLVYTTTGISIDSMSFSLGGDGELLVTVTGIAKDTIESTATAMLAVFDYTDGFRFGQFQAGITGVDKLKTFDFNWNANRKTDSYLIDKTGARGDASAGINGLSGSLTSVISDGTLYASARNFVTLPLAMSFTNELAGTALRTIDFDMLEAKLNSVSNPSIGQSDAIDSSFNYEAFYTNNVNETALMITIVNELVAY